MPLREKCPNTEFLLVFTDYILLIHVVNLKKKYGPEKTPYLSTFHAMMQIMKIPASISFSQTLFSGLGSKVRNRKK